MKSCIHLGCSALHPSCGQATKETGHDSSWVEKSSRIPFHGQPALAQTTFSFPMSLLMALSGNRSALKVASSASTPSSMHCGHVLGLAWPRRENCVLCITAPARYNFFYHCLCPPTRDLRYSWILACFFLKFKIIWIILSNKWNKTKYIKRLSISWKKLSRNMTPSQEELWDCISGIKPLVLKCSKIMTSTIWRSYSQLGRWDWSRMKDILEWSLTYQSSFTHG